MNIFNSCERKLDDYHTPLSGSIPFHRLRQLTIVRLADSWVAKQCVYVILQWHSLNDGAQKMFTLLACFHGTWSYQECISLIMTVNFVSAFVCVLSELTTFTQRRSCLTLQSSFRQRNPAFLKETPVSKVLATKCLDMLDGKEEQSSVDYSECSLFVEDSDALNKV
ncbi:hypothetical protein D918_02358 [Trichuris suis]|nr:hypothetical protein D918_02358 [Trichuris suis]